MHKILRCLLLIYLLLLLICASSLYAQNPAPVHAVDGEYIREWLVLGPFFPDDLKTDFLASVGGEANIVPEEGDTVSTEDERLLEWRKHTSEESPAVSLLDVMDSHAKATAYAFCILQSEAAGRAAIQLIHAGSAAIWLNGGQIYGSPAGGLPVELETDLKAGANTVLIKASPQWLHWFFQIQVKLLPPDRAVLSGKATGMTGKAIPGAVVRLEYSRDGVMQTRTDTLGNYHLNIYPVLGPYDLSITASDLGCWQTDIRLHKREQKSLDMTLREAISIEGTLFMLDDMTPHNAVPVQAIREGEVIATTLSDQRGKYRFINLKPGSYQLRCQVLGGYVYYGEERARKPKNGIGKSIGLQVEQRKNLRNINFRFAVFKKGAWKNYTVLDGLAENKVIAITQDSNGALWFGTYSGVSRYDGKEFVTFTREDGLAGGMVRAIYSDPDGTMWFGTNSGVSRYSGGKFDKPLTVEDGLPNDMVGVIHRAPDGALWFGTGWWTVMGGGISRYDGKQFENFSVKDGLAHGTIWSIYSDPDGAMWIGTNGGICQYNNGEFISFTSITRAPIRAIHRSPDGAVWFGIGRLGILRYCNGQFEPFDDASGLIGNSAEFIGGDADGIIWFGRDRGLSRYDGECFVNFTHQDGFTDERVNVTYIDSDGILWVGTDGGGIFQYDEKTFLNLTAKDGLANSCVYDTYRDPEGALWFGCRDSVSRYDEGVFSSFSKRDGLTDSIHSIARTTNGTMWFGSLERGVFIYDGNKFRNLTDTDGLADNEVEAILAAPDNVVWIGTRTGLSSYDDGKITNFTEKDGLPHRWITGLDSESDGTLWIGTSGGLAQFDGETFRKFNRENESTFSGWLNAIHCAEDDTLWLSYIGWIVCLDGHSFTRLNSERNDLGTVLDIYSDSNDILWFGTEGKGVIACDGTAWTSLDTRDGLPGNIANSITGDPDGSLWFSTDGGAAHYQRSEAQPGIHITAISTEQDTYRDLTAIPAFASGTYITINYSAIDFKTILEKRQYRYQVKEIDAGWRKPTRDDAFTDIFRKPGTHTFMVQAIDRDLNYSEPASVKIDIAPLPFYQTGIFLVLVTIIGSLFLLATIFLGIQRWRLAHDEKIRLQNELQDAREVQLSLLPEAAPPVDGIEIAGKSIAANTVGGDFFDYLALSDGKVGIAVADVSGKGLRAAMNAAMTAGILHDATTIEPSCGGILTRLNMHLHPLMGKHMFTAFSFSILDTDSGVIQWSNAAQPFPLIKRSDGASEADEDSELPLGMMPDVKYSDYELKLQSGDTVIFYTDGIIEAENEAEEMYGTERLVGLVTTLDPTMSSEGVIDAILQDVAQFTGTTEQYDDMTIVVLKKL